MAETSTTTTFYNVTNTFDTNGAQGAKRVALGWNQLGSNAYYVVDLVNYPVSFTVPATAPVSSTITLGLVTGVVTFPSIDYVRGLSTWIKQTITACSASGTSPPELAGNGAGEANSQVTLSFNVESGGSAVALTVDTTGQNAFYGFKLTDVPIQTPAGTPQPNEIITQPINAQVQVPFTNVATACDLANWILLTVPDPNAGQGE